MPPPFNAQGSVPPRWVNVVPKSGAATPANDVALPGGCVALYVGVAGNVGVVDSIGVRSMFTCPAGVTLIGQFVQLQADAVTTASNILAAY